MDLFHPFALRANPDTSFALSEPTDRFIHADASPPKQIAKDLRKEKHHKSRLSSLGEISFAGINCNKDGGCHVFCWLVVAGKRSSVLFCLGRCL